MLNNSFIITSNNISMHFMLFFSISQIRLTFSNFYESTHIEVNNTNCFKLIFVEMHNIYYIKYNICTYVCEIVFMALTLLINDLVI